MLDSLNVVAVGDSGLFFRTTDGGKHWSWQYLDSGRIHAVHFSDLQTGVIVEWMSGRDLATTTDGGVHWKWHDIDTAHYPGYWIWDAESLGGLKFRAMDVAAGPFYYTADNWETVDRSRIVFDTSDRYNNIRNFRSLGVDTVVAYGPWWDGHRGAVTIKRSLDGGRTWSSVVFDDTVLGDNPWMSRLDRPYTVLAGHNRHYQPGYVGLSRDSGQTWQFAPLSFDTSAPSYFSEPSLVEVTPSGVAIAICSVGGAGDFVSPTFVARTILTQQNVDGYERLVYGTSLYPNPATISLSVQSVDYCQPLLMYDILGHEVLRGKLDGSGHAQFDVSALPRGVYGVILKHNGIPLPIGKVVVVGR
jgi:hypothetical protein